MWLLLLDLGKKKILLAQKISIFRLSTGICRNAQQFFVTDVAVLAIKLVFKQSLWNSCIKISSISKLWISLWHFWNTGKRHTFEKGNIQRRDYKERWKSLYRSVARWKEQRSSNKRALHFVKRITWSIGYSFDGKKPNILCYCHATDDETDQSYKSFMRWASWTFDTSDNAGGKSTRASSLQAQTI